MSTPAEVSRVQIAAAALVAGSVTQAQSTEVIAAAQAVVVDPIITPTGPTGSTGSTSPPPPGTVTATRLSPNNPETPFGGYGFYFSPACMMSNGVIHHVWQSQDKDGNSIGGTWEYDAINKTATRVKSGPPNNPENMGCCYVPSVNMVYNGAGGPDGGTNVVQNSKFDRANKAYIPLPLFGNADACHLYDPTRDRLVMFGGWTPDANNVYIRPLNQQPWTTLQVGNAPVCLPETGSGITFLRAAMGADGITGIIDNTDVLKEWDGTSANWVNRPTTGTKPPKFAVMCRVNDTYVAYVGYNALSQGAQSAPGSPRCVAYVCPRSTWVWTATSILALPVLGEWATMSQNILVPDNERNRAILLIGSGYVEMIALTLT